MTKIEWCDRTPNPIRGCSPVSPGCDNCFAGRMANRHSGRGGAYHGLTVPGTTRYNGEVRFLPERMQLVPKRRKGQIVFVNSMSDVFHENVPSYWVDQLMLEIQKLEHLAHYWLVLTKRARRLRHYLDGCRLVAPADRMWFGVSVESRGFVKRIEALPLYQEPLPGCGGDGLHRGMGPRYFASCEPLLGRCPIPPELLRRLSWVIVGGETGPKARRIIDPAWVREIRDQCLELGVPFFFKGWGDRRPGKEGKGKFSNRADPERRLLDGRTWEQFPKEFNRE